MATSEKIITIANNTEKVFNAGYNKGLKENPPGASEEELQQKYDEGYTIGWRDGASSATDLWYTNGYGDGKRDGIEEGLGKAILTQEEFLADKPQTYYDAFWDVYQDGGKPTSYSRAFSANWRSLDLFKPKYDIIATEAYMMFTAFPLEIDLENYLQSIGRSLDVSKATNTQYMFQASNITRVGVIDVSSSTNSVPLDNTFAQCRKLVTIDKLVIKTGGRGEFSNTFSNCTALENLTIEGTIANNGLNLEWSTLLSKTSIESIINALSTTTSGLTVTLSQTAVNNAFTTEEWNALIATKSNWTISLA